MPDETEQEQESRRRRLVLFSLGLLAWATRLLPVANFLEIHKRVLQTRIGKAADWVRRRVQNVVSYLRQHGVALAASFVGVAVLGLLLATLTGPPERPIPPEPTAGAVVVPPSLIGSPPLSPPAPSSSLSNSSTPTLPSLSPSASSRPPGPTPAAGSPSPNSSRSPRPTSSFGASQTPAPRPSSEPTPSIAPSPPAPSPSRSPSPSPRPTPSATPRPSPVPTPTATPSPTPTPAPSGRPHDCRHMPRCHRPPHAGGGSGPMGIDTMKVLYTYSIATLIILGGLLFLYFSRNDPPGGQAQGLVPVVTGFIGAAVQFVFNRETQATTAAQVAKATDAANQNAANVLTAAVAPNVLSASAPEMQQQMQQP